MAPKSAMHHDHDVGTTTKDLWASGDRHIAGRLEVRNHCADTIWVSLAYAGNAKQTTAGDQTDYRPVNSGKNIHVDLDSVPNIDFGGAAVKILTDDAWHLKAWDGEVLQFEYDWNSVDHKTWYDISNINGAPFAQHGVWLTPDMHNPPGFDVCVETGCVPGGNDENGCPGVYFLPDQEKTHSCPETANFVLDMCTGGGKVSRNWGTKTDENLNET